MKLSLSGIKFHGIATLLLSVLFCSQGIAQVQQINTLTFRFPEKAYHRVYLASFYGETTSMIDSALTRPDGSITFNFSKSRASGLYRCILDKTSFADFIYNKEDVAIIIYPDDAEVKMDVVSSPENQVYQSFLRKDIGFKKKLEALSFASNAYSPRDKFYQVAEKEYEDLQLERSRLIDDLVMKNKGTYVAKLLQMYREPILKFSWNDEARKSFFREHYFEYLHVDDTALLRTSVYPNKIIQYLMLYSDPQKPKEPNEKSFMKGVDVVLSNCNKDTLVYEFLLSYLIEGFEHYGFEAVVNHLYDKYLSDRSCSHSDKLGKIAGRIEADHKLAKGTKAPEWSLKDITGRQYTSASTTQDYTLLVFWASWCPHCTQLLPQIQSMTSGVKLSRLQIVTVSMDTSLVAWHSFVGKLKVPWLQACDGLGWQGKIPTDYNVYATPTMVLIDRSRKIIAKPITSAQLRQALNEVGLIP